MQCETWFFSIDALQCPRCTTPLVVLALISDPPIVARILTHLGVPSTPPAIAPVRRPGGDDTKEDRFIADMPWADLETPVGEVEDDVPDTPRRRIDDGRPDDDAPP